MSFKGQTRETVENLSFSKDKDKPIYWYTIKFKDGSGHFAPCMLMNTIRPAKKGWFTMDMMFLKDLEENDISE